MMKKKKQTRGASDKGRGVRVIEEEVEEVSKAEEGGEVERGPSFLSGTVGASFGKGKSLEDFLHLIEGHPVEKVGAEMVESQVNLLGQHLPHFLADRCSLKQRPCHSFWDGLSLVFL